MTNEKKSETDAAPVAAPVVVAASSILDKIRQTWKDAGSKNPSTNEKEAGLAAYKNAGKSVTDAEKALSVAKEHEGETVLALAKLFGCRSLRIDGVIHDFASRGEKIFFRRKLSSDVVDL